MEERMIKYYKTENYSNGHRDTCVTLSKIYTPKIFGFIIVICNCNNILSCQMTEQAVINDQDEPTCSLRQEFDAMFYCYSEPSYNVLLLSAKVSSNKVTDIHCIPFGNRHRRPSNKLLSLWHAQRL